MIDKEYGYDTEPYNSMDALAIEGRDIEAEDTELIELLTRLRKTFDSTYRGEESS